MTNVSSQFQLVMLNFIFKKILTCFGFYYANKRQYKCQFQMNPKRSKKYICNTSSRYFLTSHSTFLITLNFSQIFFLMFLKLIFFFLLSVFIFCLLYNDLFSTCFFEISNVVFPLLNIFKRPYFSFCISFLCLKSIFVYQKLNKYQ